MKQKHAIYAGLLAIGIASTGPAMAQLLPYPPAALPPQDVVALVRSTGLEPVTRPVRQGPAYVLNAVNPSGREVRVVVDARLGRVVRVVPLGPARQTAQAVPPLPAPYGRPPADIAVPDGLGPTARVAGLPPDDVDDIEPYGRVAAVGPMQVPPQRRTSAPNAGSTSSVGPTTSQSGPPPLPRPRPKLAAAEQAVPPESAAQVTAPAATARLPRPAVCHRSPPRGRRPRRRHPPEPVYEEHE